MRKKSVGPAEDGGQLYDIPALTAMWSVSDAWIYRRIHAGDLRAFRLGRRWVVREEEASRFLRELEATDDAA